MSSVAALSPLITSGPSFEIITVSSGDKALYALHPNTLEWRRVDLAQFYLLNTYGRVDMQHFKECLQAS